MLIEGVESRVSLKIPESFAGNIGVAFWGYSLRAVNANVDWSRSRRTM